MCFSANVEHYFLKSNNVGRHFCLYFQGFCPDFKTSKLLVEVFHPLHPASYTTAPEKSTFGPCLEKILPAPIFRGTCSSTEMLKGYMSRESLGTPDLDCYISCRLIFLPCVCFASIYASTAARSYIVNYMRIAANFITKGRYGCRSRLCTIGLGQGSPKTQGCQVLDRKYGKCLTYGNFVAKIF